MMKKTLNKNKILFTKLLVLTFVLTTVFSLNITTVFAATKHKVKSETDTAAIVEVFDDTKPNDILETWYYNYGSDKKITTINGLSNVDGSSLDVGKNPLSLSVGATYVLQKTGTQQAKDAIADIKSQMNVHADINSAAGALAPIIEMVNSIIGILATIILIGIGFFTAVDVLYLEVPALHTSMDDKAMSKGQTGKSGGVKPKIVSEDASQAYKEAQETGKNVLLIYLKKRIVAYIAVAIVLYMLLSGNLSLIVEVVLKMLNGVFGWVEDYSATM